MPCVNASRVIPRRIFGSPPFASAAETIRERGVPRTSRSASPVALVTIVLGLTIGSAPAQNEKGSLAVPPAGPELWWTGVDDISEDWLYLEREAPEPPSADAEGYVPVELPHTWNDEDALERVDYRRAASWYRRTLTLTPSESNERLYLRFGAAGNQAQVYVNGRKLNEHVGGYAAFTTEITDAVEPGANAIAVRVSNAPRDDLPPLDIDHNIYGGLYRGVHVVRGPVVGFSRVDRGGPGVRLISNEVSSKSADVRVEATLDSGADGAMDVEVVAELRNDRGQPVSFASREVRAEPGRRSVAVQMPDVVSPKLWSPSSPSLYRLRLTLWDDRNIIDRVELDYGFRSFRFTPNEGFFLNGESFEVRGVNRHQDIYRQGNALEAEDHVRDMRMIKELGANAVRLAHYQQDDLVLTLCDRLGLLVWEEIPLVNEITDSPAFKENTANMLRDMIAQHAHHTSVVVWGLQNEFVLKQPSLFEEKRALLRRLHGIAKQMDPTRPTGIACHGVPMYAEEDLTSIADIVGYNVYYGWYGDQFSDLTRILSGFRDHEPDRAHLITEYGAGSDIRVQRARPERFDFSEQWQCRFIESYLDQAEAMPWLNGTFYWNMFDFGASHRGDTIPGVNQKGLITFDRSTKKDAYFLVKSRWVDDPVLHLAGARRSHQRGGPERTFRAYTNLDRVRLMHNGRAVGARSGMHEWTVRLVPGPNRVEVRGAGDHRDLSHGYTVVYEPDAQPRPDDAE